MLKKSSPKQWNKVMTLASLPLMLIVITMASRSLSQKAAVSVEPPAGMIVVANLRSEDLTLIELGPKGQLTTLALPGAAHELAVVNGRLYATAPRASLLLEIAPYAPGILRERPLGGAPHGIAQDGAGLLVTLDDANELLRLDLETLGENERQATGLTPHTVVAVDGTAYVTASRESRLQAFGSAPAAVVTGALPESVAAAGEYIVTADNQGDSVSIFRRPGLEPAGRVHTGGQPVRVMAYDSAHVAVSLSSTGEVALIDLKAKKVTRRLKVGPYPDGLCIDPTGAYAAVATNGDHSLRMYALPGWAYIATFAAGDGPGACAWLPAR